MIHIKRSVGWSVGRPHAELEDHYTHRPPVAPLAYNLDVPVCFKFVG